MLILPYLKTNWGVPGAFYPPVCIDRESQAPVNTATNFYIPLKAEYFIISWATINFRRILLSIDFVG
jgi:hypothetical protein